MNNENKVYKKKNKVYKDLEKKEKDGTVVRKRCANCDHMRAVHAWFKGRYYEVGCNCQRYEKGDIR